MNYEIIQDSSGSENEPVELENEKIPAIEYIKNIPRPEDQLALTLVFKGEKPAAMLNGNVFTFGVIKMLGLPFSANFETKPGALPILIAKNQETLDVLLQIEKIEDGVTHDIELGKVLGYPDTSIEAFSNGQTLRFEDVPAYVHESGILEFVTFAFSREHWKEELEILKDQIKSAGELVPELLEKVDWNKLEKGE